MKQSEYEKQFLELGVRVAGMMAEQSIIEKAVLRVLLIREFGNSENVRWYYCDIIYCFLPGNLKTKTNFENGYMGVAVNQFEKWDMELKPTETDRDRNEHGVWAVTV